MVIHLKMKTKNLLIICAWKIRLSVITEHRTKTISDVLSSHFFFRSP